GVHPAPRCVTRRPTTPGNVHLGLDPSRLAPSGRVDADLCGLLRRSKERGRGQTDSRIIDTMGRTVMKYTTSAEGPVLHISPDISGLPKGTYILYLEQADNVYTLRFSRQ
ncbi:MAG: T9SS type A sorting domain-containing protein, partial [Cyclobacteriaceae bacterium]